MSFFRRVVVVPQDNGKMKPFLFDVQYDNLRTNRFTKMQSYNEKIIEKCYVSIQF